MRRIVSTCALALAVAFAAPASWADRADEARTRAFEQLGLGVSAYKQGDFKRAVEMLEESAGIALNNFRAHYYLGLARIGDRQYEESLEALAVALDLDPRHLLSHVATGDAHLKLGDLAEANASYFRALKIRPGFPAALDGLGRALEAQAKDREAIERFREAIASNAGYAPAYTHLGDLYLSQERFEEAVQLLEEAISIRSDYAPGLNRLARAYGRLGLNNEAIATIQRAIELQPKNAQHLATLGELQILQGYLLAAEGSFIAALDIDEELADAHVGLAELSRVRGEYTDALDEIDLALEDPRIPPSRRRQIQRLRLAYKQESTRIVRLEEQTQQESPASEDLAALAQIYADRGQWREAADLVAREEESLDQQERRAYLLYRAGEFRQALAVYDALLAQRETSALRLNHGVTWTALGDDLSARKSYERALELDAENDQARLYLANALFRGGETPAAIEAFDRFLRRNPRGEDAERVRRILLQLAPELVQPLPDPTAISTEGPLPPPDASEEETAPPPGDDA